MVKSEISNIDSIQKARICAKEILRTVRFGALAVCEPDTGHPLISKVGLASDIDGSPVLLLSQISTHTKAIKNDSRCSLLLGDGGVGDPLNEPRISLIAKAAQIPQKSELHKNLRDRYLRHQPYAKVYIDFRDFSFFRIEFEKANLNAGFGQFYVLESDDIILSQNWIPDLRRCESDIISQSNKNSEQIVNEFVKTLEVDAKKPWKIISVDPEGFNLSAGNDILRVNFLATINETNDLVREFVENIKTSIESESNSIHLK